jgi:hypothetical protein
MGAAINGELENLAAFGSEVRAVAVPGISLPAAGRD